MKRKQKVYTGSIKLLDFFFYDIMKWQLEKCVGLSLKCIR